MNAARSGQEDSAPQEQAVSRHSSDLQESVGRVDERIRNIENTMVTKEYLANSSLQALRTVVFYVIVPLIFTLLGFSINIVLKFIPPS